MSSFSDRVQRARASRDDKTLTDAEVLTLQLAVAADPSLAERLSTDRMLLSSLTQLAQPSPASLASASSLEPPQVAASWLCCAFGSPPSSHNPRGLFRTTSLPAMLASRIGPNRKTRSRRPEDGVRILALDGGGTRALVTIEMLKELERQTGQRVHELFDVIAGTSTGGILAAGIQERLTLEELEKLYLDISIHIFAKEPGWRVQLLRTGGQYRVAKLEDILKRTFPRLPQAEQLAAALTHDASVEAAAAATAEAAAAAAAEAAAAAGTGTSSSAQQQQQQQQGAATGGGGDWKAGFRDATALTMLERRALQEAAYAAGVAAERTPHKQPPRPPRDPASGSSASASSAPGDASSDDALPPSRPPHVLVVAALTSTAPPTPFIFRNYEYPHEPAGSASTVLERHAGTSSVPLWQALRATTAAPSYFAASEMLLASSGGNGGGNGGGGGGGSGGRSASVAADGVPLPAAAEQSVPAAGEGSGSASAAAAASCGWSGDSHAAATQQQQQQQQQQAAASEKAAAVVAAAEVRADGLGAIDADHPAVKKEDLYPIERSIFQDGGLLANNPSAIALHEARMLFPHAPIACLASFGTGAFPVEQAKKPGSWSSVVATIVRAATRTEEVHQMLSDLLPVLRVPYYRFNPQVPAMRLDEISPHKLKELQGIGKAHVVSGGGKQDCAALAQLLTTGRGRPQVAPSSGVPTSSVVRKGLRSWPASLLLKLGSRVRGRYSRL